MEVDAYRRLDKMKEKKKTKKNIRIWENSVFYSGEGRRSECIIIIIIEEGVSILVKKLLFLV